jgi:hypothetical protein
MRTELDKLGNDRLTKANWAWMVVGAVGWVFVVVGLVMPDQG